MGSLTHVCVWSSKGWTHIAPEEVARSHPVGVSSWKRFPASMVRFVQESVLDD